MDVKTLIRRLFEFLLAASCCLSIPAAYGTSAFGQLAFGTSAETREITFTATPGQYVSLTIQERLQEQGQGINISGITITVLAPNGAVLNGTSIMQPPVNAPTYNFACNLPGQPWGCFGNSIVNLGPLPAYAAGTTFTARITATGTGVLTYSVLNPYTSPEALVVNGPSMFRSINVEGQGVMIPVNLTLGQHYGLTVTETNRNIPKIQGLVLDPNGNAVAGIYLEATCEAPCNVGGLNRYSGWSSSGIGTAVTGTHTILLQQVTQTSGPSTYGPLSGDLTLQITSP
jgi:hypothetical protein